MSAKYFNSNLDDAPWSYPLFGGRHGDFLQCKGRRKSMDMCVTKLKMLENISGLFFLYFGGATEPA